ncbi:MAG: 50S ribosomal protein L14e [Candidatus Woesearchaeota archaeon]|nr:50S ribosomal protein L14e [Candidatus Woesearchaeota archaeon]
MFEIGRLCVKTAGRDAGAKCVIVDIINNNYVLIDGQSRRRKCNISHLEPLNKKLDIKKGCSHEEIIKEFKKLGIEIKEKRPKKKQEKPIKQKKIKDKEPIEKESKTKSKK